MGSFLKNSKVSSGQLATEVWSIGLIRQGDTLGAGEVLWPMFAPSHKKQCHRAYQKADCLDLGLAELPTYLGAAATPQHSACGGGKGGAVDKRAAAERHYIRGFETELNSFRSIEILPTCDKVEGEGESEGDGRLVKVYDESLLSANNSLLDRALRYSVFLVA